MKPPPRHDADEARAREILKAMERLDRGRRPTRRGISPVWILTVLLVLAIALVIVIGRERFVLIWRHLLRPDSIPQQ